MAAGTMMVRWKQRQLIEEGDGDWIGRVGLMESGGEWGRVIAEGECIGRVMAESEGECTGRKWTGVVRR